MDLIKKINNTIKDWSIISKELKENIQNEQNTQLNIKIHINVNDRHQLGNLVYINVLKNIIKLKTETKIYFYIQKDETLVDWSFNDFLYEVSILLLLEIKKNSINDEIFIKNGDKEENLKWIISENYNFKTVIPILKFEKNVEWLKKTIDLEKHLKNSELKPSEIMKIDENNKKSYYFMKLYLKKYFEDIENADSSSVINIKKICKQFNILTMFLFSYLSILENGKKIKFVFHDNNIMEFNEFANIIQNFSNGIYQIIENSCNYSNKMESLFILSRFYPNRFSNQKKSKDFQYVLKDYEHDEREKLSFLKNFGFILGNEDYALVRLIDTVTLTNPEGEQENLVKKASGKNSLKTLYEYFDDKLKLLNNPEELPLDSNVDSTCNVQIESRDEKYGIPLFLLSAKTLKIQSIISSGKEGIILNFHDNFITKPLEDIKSNKDIHISINEFVTEYTCIMPISKIEKVNKNIECKPNITILDEMNLKIISYNISDFKGIKEKVLSETSQSIKNENKKKLSKELINKLADEDNSILKIQVNSSEFVSIEILVKSIANLIYDRVVKKNKKVYIALIFEDEFLNCKLKIKEFFFFYKILNNKLIKLIKLIKKSKNIDYNDNDIQIALYIFDSSNENKELVYISTIVGIDWNVVLQSFINNILYNNEFLDDKIFDMYIDNIEINSKSISENEIKVLPFELFVNSQNKPLGFIEKIGQIIEKSSICHKNVNVLLGSGIHLSKFYEAEHIFQSRYITSRIALLIKDDLIKSELENKKIVILGYAPYSHLLCETLKRLLQDAEVNLNRSIETYIFKHSNMSYEELEYQDYLKKDSYYIAIIPIGSTLNTIHKINKMLNCIIENEDNNCTIDRIYNILTVAPSNEKNDYYEIRKSSKENFYDINLQGSPNFNVRSLIIKKINYNNFLETPISMVDRTSTLQRTICKMENEDKIENIEIKKFNCLKKSVKYGHYELNNKHYLFYINFEKILKEDNNVTNIIRDITKKLKVANNDKLNDVNKKIEIDILALNIIVSPLSGSNNKFLELIMTNVFSGNAILIQFDKNYTFRENFIHKYSHIKDQIEAIMESGTNTKVNFYFVDTTISSGRTLNRAKELVNSLISKLKQKKEYTNRFLSRIFEKIFLFASRSSKNTLSTLMDDESNVYRYIDINCPVFDMNGLTCPDCKITENYLKLSKNLLDNKSDKSWENKAEKHKAVKITNASNLNYEEEDFIRLCITHLLLENKKAFNTIYDELYSHEGDIENKERECYKKVEKLKNYVKNICNRDLFNKCKNFEKSFDCIFIRVISRPFLTTYESIKQVSFVYMKYLFEEKIRDQNYDDDELITIINRISYYGTNYLNEKFNLLEIKDKKEKFKESVKNALIFEKACARGIVK